MNHDRRNSPSSMLQEYGLLITLKYAKFEVLNIYDIDTQFNFKEVVVSSEMIVLPSSIRS